jgi:hypothetical protein
VFSACLANLRPDKFVGLDRIVTSDPPINVNTSRCRAAELTSELGVTLVPRRALVDLASDVAFQAAHDLALGLSFGCPSRDLVDRGLMPPSKPHHHDPVKCRVRVAVSATVQPVPGHLPGGSLDRRHPAELGKRRLRATALGVVAGGELTIAAAGRVFPARLLTVPTLPRPLRSLERRDGRSVAGPAAPWKSWVICQINVECGAPPHGSQQPLRCYPRGERRLSVGGGTQSEPKATTPLTAESTSTSGPKGRLPAWVVPARARRGPSRSSARDCPRRGARDGATRWNRS